MRRPEAPGLYKRGAVFWVRYSHGGKQIRRSTGTTVRKEAEAFLAKIKTEVFAGAHFPERRAGQLTVEGLRDKWLAAKRLKKSIRDDGVRFQRIVEFFGADRAVSDITSEDVNEFRDALLEEPVQRRRDPEAKRGAKGAKPKRRTMAPQTVDHHLILLRAALRWADRAGYVTRKPEVKLLGVRANRADRVATDEEYRALVEGATGELQLAIIVARGSGMRMGEIVALTWDRIDLKRGLVKLRDEDTKNAEGRAVPLGTEAVEALRAWPRRLGSPRVFQVKDSHSLSPRFSRLCKALGISNLHFHDLRGTRLTELRRAGADLKVIQKISGHRTLAVLVERYQGVTEDELLEAARKAERKR